MQYSGLLRQVIFLPPKINLLLKVPKRKWYVLCAATQRWVNWFILNMGYNSAKLKNKKQRKDTKDKEAAPNLNSSSLNQVLAIRIKTIHLFCSNVVASLERALNVDVLFKTSFLKVPSHVKLRFIKGDWQRTKYLLSINSLFINRNKKTHVNLSFRLLIN